MWFFSRFAKKNGIMEELKELNESSNTLFADVFDKCRLTYGRELVEVMNLKSAMLQSLEENSTVKRERTKSGTGNSGFQNADTRVKIAFNLMKLVISYLKAVMGYTALSDSGFPENVAIDAVSVNLSDEQEEKRKERLDKAYELIKSLNRHFYLAAADNAMSMEFEETLNQAEALCNAISMHYEESRGDCDP